MATFTVRQGKRYRAKIQLGWLEAFASNELIAGKLRAAGFSGVGVSGSGETREAEALWPMPTAPARCPASRRDRGNHRRLTGTVAPSSIVGAAEPPQRMRSSCAGRRRLFPNGNGTRGEAGLADAIITPINCPRHRATAMPLHAARICDICAQVGCGNAIVAGLRAQLAEACDGLRRPFLFALANSSFAKLREQCERGLRAAGLGRQTCAKNPCNPRASGPRTSTRATTGAARCRRSAPWPSISRSGSITAACTATGSAAPGRRWRNPSSARCW